MISELAYVSPKARIGENVEIKPFAYIDDDVVIGDGCVIMPYASIMNGVTMGKNNHVFQNCVIGSEPQDLNYNGEPTKVVIGDGNYFRENSIVAGGFIEGRLTEIGNNNYFCSKSHICHDVHVHNDSIVGISASVAANGTLGQGCVLASAAIVQQGVRIGRYALVQSGCRVQKDVPPFIILGGNPAAYHGIFSQMLESLKTSPETQHTIMNAYRIIYTGNFSIEDAVLRIKEQLAMSPEIQSIVKFIDTSKKGIVRDYNEF